MAPFAFLAGLTPARQLLAAIAGPLILTGLGFGAGVAFEHRGPQGFPAALLGKSLKVQRDDARAVAASNAVDRDFWKARAIDWRGAHDRCAEARRRDNARATTEVTADSVARARTADLTFDRGYAAGRVAGVLAGRKTCGAPDAATPSSLPAADPADPVGDLLSGVLRDAVAAPGSGGDGGFNAGAYRPGH